MRSPVPTFLLLLCVLGPGANSAEIGSQVVARDAFPVFDNPQMLSAAEAERVGVVFDNAVVIGVAHNGEAKAYPVAVMGVHELGNDTLGGVPIAISW